MLSADNVIWARRDPGLLQRPPVAFDAPNGGGDFRAANVRDPPASLLDQVARSDFADLVVFTPTKFASKPPGMRSINT